MAHIEKYTRSASGQLCQHYERKKLPDGSYVKFGNEDIDLSKTHLNYNLAPDRTLKGQIEFINQRCSEVKCLNRKDVNVMCSWVVTQPKDFPVEKSVDFFEKTYKFLNERYGGEKNVISAFVHQDEHTPHIHYAFVPVVKDKKSGKYKVSAKEAVTMRDLKTFHQDLEKYLYEYFGFEIGILNGATKEGNLSIKALKLKSEVENLEKQENELKGKVEGLQGELGSYKALEVSATEIDNIGSKGLFGKISVPADKYALLQEQAKAYCANRDIIENMRERQAQLEEKEKSVSRYQSFTWDERKQLERDREKFNCEKEKARRDFHVMFNKQHNLNAHCEKIEGENAALKKENSDLKKEKEQTVAQLTAQHQAALKSALEAAQSRHNLTLQAEKKKNAVLVSDKEYLESTVYAHTDTITKLKAALRGAYENLTQIIKAAGMLKYDDGDYKATLTPKQERLIDGIANYGAVRAKADGFPDLAEKIKDTIGISKDIQAHIDEITPKKKTQSYSR